MAKLTLTAAVFISVAAAGCASTRYPIAHTWSAADSQAMSCAQLRAEAEDSLRLERQIDAIAAGDAAARKTPPALYSTAKLDADRAAAARLAAIQDAMQAKVCPA